MPAPAVTQVTCKRALQTENARSEPGSSKKDKRPNNCSREALYFFKKVRSKRPIVDVTGTITAWRAALSKTAVRNLKFDFRPANWKAAA